MCNALFFWTAAYFKITFENVFRREELRQKNSFISVYVVVIETKKENKTWMEFYGRHYVFQECRVKHSEKAF